MNTPPMDPKIQFPSNLGQDGSISTAGANAIYTARPDMGVKRNVATRGLGLPTAA